MTKSRFERKYWVLLVLDAANGKPLTPVQLQKSIFLVGKKLEIPEKYYYAFKPYDYGPFCVDVYRDAELLEVDSLITIGYASNLKWKIYSITFTGTDMANKMKASLKENEAQKIKEIVDQVLQQDFRELVKGIYKEFPEFSVNSVFRG